MMALSPLVVFMVFYLGMSLWMGDFYKMPLAVAFLVATAWGLALMRRVPFAERVETFSREAGRSSVLYMIWIFILAGAFAALARQVGAVEATVDLALRYLPAGMLVPGLFVAACFISLSIGTSVGTVVALVPIAAELASEGAGGAGLPFMVSVVVGGAFFGDNLSFISDTTIAATRTQGVKMNDKFKTNLRIVLPAALVTLAVYIILGTRVENVAVREGVNYWLVVPYLVVIATALAGMNVTKVLALGIVTTLVLGFVFGQGCADMLMSMGQGIDSVGNLIVVTLLAAGLLGVIKALGGIDWTLRVMTRWVKGSRGAQACIAALVSLVNLCTANNTVAIVTVGQLSHDISERFGVDPRKSASILDTCSCIVQSLIPYGAQMLLAASLAGISPVGALPYMYYAWALAAAVAISIVLKNKKKAEMFGN